MWFYERARGSYQTARAREGSTDARRRAFDKKYPSHQRFTKEDLAKFDNCWRGYPHIVNRGGQKNFTQFMTIIKQERGELSENWEPSPEECRRYIARGILFRDVQRIVKADETITAYRINVTTFTASLLAEKSARRIDLDTIWKRQQISEALAETAGLWCRVVFKELLKYAQQQSVHIDNVLKSQACWQHMLSLDLRLPASVQRELLSVVPPGAFPPSDTNPDRLADQISNQDHNNMARCMELNAALWMQVVAWGNGQGQLTTLQLGVATTLASYAAQGWTRTPSPKQAKHGATMIEAARSAGII